MFVKLVCHTLGLEPCIADKMSCFQAMLDRVGWWYYPAQFLQVGLDLERMILELEDGPQVPKTCHGSDQSRTTMVEEVEPKAELKRSSMSSNNGFLVVVVVVVDKEEEEEENSRTDGSSSFSSF